MGIIVSLVLLVFVGFAIFLCYHERHTDDLIAGSAIILIVIALGVWTAGWETFLEVCGVVVMAILSSAATYQSLWRRRSRFDINQHGKSF